MFHDISSGVKNRDAHSSNSCAAESSMRNTILECRLPRTSRRVRTPALIETVSFSASKEAPHDGGNKGTFGLARPEQNITLPVLVGERHDQAMHSVFTHFAGESLAICRDEAHAVDLDVVNLPARRQFFHVIVHVQRV